MIVVANMAKCGWEPREAGWYSMEVVTHNQSRRRLRVFFSRPTYRTGRSITTRLLSFHATAKRGSAVEGMVVTV